MDYKSARAMIVLAIVLAACGGHAGPPAGGGDGGTTGSSCDPACGGNQVCSNGACMDLPAMCPCPSGSYCDLAQNTCKAGCVADEQCSAGDYCDTTARTCKPGCRTASDCPVNPAECLGATQCTNGTCVYPPGPDGIACSSDGNFCTADRCQAGVCSHTPTHIGQTCATGDPCKVSVCSSAGTCATTNKPDGPEAGCDDGNACSDDVCHAGACSHPAVADTTTCDGAGGKAGECFAGTCLSLDSYCDDWFNVYLWNGSSYYTYLTSTGGRCNCNGNTLTGSGDDWHGAHLSYSDPCTQCYIDTSFGAHTPFQCWK